MRSTLFLLAVLGLLFAYPATAQNLLDLEKPIAGKMQKLGRSRPLQKLPTTTNGLSINPKKLKKLKEAQGRKEIKNFSGVPQKAAERNDDTAPDGALQPPPSGGLINLGVNVEGLDLNDSEAIPPDVAGVIGENYFIHMTNGVEGAVYIIYNKQGQKVFGPANLNALWQEFGVESYGDPIVLYDQEKKRWLISEISYPFDGSNKMLVAVTVTDDPLGEWEAYEISAPDLPDYPKYAVWNDAVLITTNEPDFDKIPVYAINRNELFGLATDVGIQRIKAIQKYDSGYNIALPVEWDGNNPPPSGSPGITLRITDNGTNDRVELNEITIDWLNSNNTVVSQPINIPISNLNFHDCPNQNECIDIPGSNVGLDVLPSVPMYRAAYRNLGTHEAIVANLTVDAGNGKAGIRWFELRRQPGDQWTLFQEGTFAPDAKHRWMGSICMDVSGNIALGYAVAGQNMPPSLYVTGRNYNDPPGQMTYEETLVAAGNAMPESVSRWGDYFTMSVDPTDEKTFWFTGEYMKDVADVWGTRVTSFTLRRDSFDIAADALLSPISSADLTTAEPVKIRVTNQGILPLNSFQVGYIFGNNPPVTANINQTLASGASYEHSFTQTVNLLNFGAYNFKVFANAPSDQLVANDTLNVTVQHLTKNDAGISGLGMPSTICTSAEKAILNIRNFGVQPLTSVVLKWKLNNLPEQTETLALNLAPGQQYSAELNVAGLLQLGNNIIVARTELPNGVVDEGEGNDQGQITFNAVAAEDALTVQFTTDAKPLEDRWEIWNLQYDKLYISPPMTQPHFTYTTELCVDVQDDCMLFLVEDNPGFDGIRAGTSAGDIKIFNHAGQILFDLVDPDISWGFVLQLCPDNSDCGALNGMITVFDNFISGNMTVISQGTGGAEPYQYSYYETGNNFYADTIFQTPSDLQGLRFFGRIRDENGCIQPVPLIKNGCPVELAFTVTNTPPGQNQGSITVEPIGLAINNEYSIDEGPYGTETVFANLAAGPHLVCAKPLDLGGCYYCEVVTVGSTVATEEHLPPGLEVALIPNPVQNHLRLEIAGSDPSADRVPFSITDALGRNVRGGTLTRWSDVLVATADTESLPNGTYFIRTVIDQTPVAIKMIKVSQ